MLMGMFSLFISTKIFYKRMSKGGLVAKSILFFNTIQLTDLHQSVPIQCGQAIHGTHKIIGKKRV